MIAEDAEKVNRDLVVYGKDGKVLSVRYGLTPPNALESALVLHLPSGAYTAVVCGANGATGNALVEVYQVD